MSKSANDSFGLLAYVLAIFTGFVGPLILYLVDSEKKGNSFENVKGALNFSIHTMVYYVISMVLMVALIGFVLMPLVYLFHLIICILGAVAASKGEVYNPPLVFVKIVK
jgi:uncharacterized Tic20 family protein